MESDIRETLGKKVNQMLYPKRLQKGDTIGIIAPASPPGQKDLHRALPFFENIGLNVKLGRHITSVHGYLAGTDDERLEDLHEMIADEAIKGIVFARGGYGTGRLVSAVNYQLIRENPKIMWGYSDLTYLHTAIRQLTGLITFHGPMVASDIGKHQFDDLSRSMFDQLFTPMMLHYTEAISPLHVIVGGEASGPIVGGNLSLIVSTLKTPYELDTTHKILLLEDIGEDLYRVDALLNQLTLAGKLTDVAGIIIGDFQMKQSEANTSQSLQAIFHHYFHTLEVPIVSGFRIGHCFPHFAIPLGVKAILSAKNKTLTIYPGVK